MQSILSILCLLCLLPVCNAAAIKRMKDKDMDLSSLLLPASPSSPLTTCISSYPTRLGKRTVDEKMKEYMNDALETAIKIWSPHLPIPLSLVSCSDNTAGIVLSFHSLSHGDKHPFDGLGGEVAHSFYPEQKRRGEIHIDIDEPWSPAGRNLAWVVSHEMGHALGLRHIAAPALMQEEYGGYRTKPVLTPRDISAIRELYGMP